MLPPESPGHSCTYWLARLPHSCPHLLQASRLAPFKGRIQLPREESHFLPLSETRRSEQNALLLGSLSTLLGAKPAAFPEYGRSEEGVPEDSLPQEARNTGSTGEGPLTLESLKGMWPGLLAMELWADLLCSAACVWVLSAPYSCPCPWSSASGYSPGVCLLCP